MTATEIKANDDVDVTFAVACYNAMPYLDTALRSALDQRDGIEREGREGGETAEHADAEQQAPRLAVWVARKNTGEHPHRQPADQIDRQRAIREIGAEPGERGAPDE